MKNISKLNNHKLIKYFLFYEQMGTESNFPESMSSFRKNFIRLVDKAVQEYTNAREHILSQIEFKKCREDKSETGEDHTIYIANELENCLNTLKRLFYHFDAIASDKSRFPIDRVFRKQIEKYKKDFENTDIRGITQHMHEYIRGINSAKSEPIEKGEPLAPMINNDASEIQVGKKILKSEDLARIIEKFYEFGADFTKYKFVPGKGYKKSFN